MHNTITVFCLNKHGGSATLKTTRKLNNDEKRALVTLTESDKRPAKKAGRVTRHLRRKSQTFGSLIAQ